MVGSVCSDQLVLHNYCVIIYERQKETFMEKNKKKHIFDQFSRQIRQFQANLVFSIFFCLDPHKSLFLSFGNDQTVVVQY